jgi:hypothetical protein
LCFFQSNEYLFINLNIEKNLKDFLPRLEKTRPSLSPKIKKKQQYLIRMKYDISFHLRQLYLLTKTTTFTKIIAIHQREMI